MPYLQEHNLIFIHIPKTGGSSIEKNLGIHRQWNHSKLIHKEESIINGIKTSPQHYTPNIIKERLGDDVYNECVKFTMVRNPYTRVLSEYFYINKRNRNLIAFEDWFNFYYSTINHDHKLAQHLFVDETVDFIGRFETLQKDYSDLISTFNINVNPTLEIVNKTTHHSKDHINEIPTSIIDKINLLYENDFIKFNYNFL